jgi:cobalt-precorrin 5A hydrolase / precorrin-3B C17-methyltransferase
MVISPAIVILGVSALPLARTLKAALGGEIHGPACVNGPDTPYEKATARFQSLFQEARPIIGLCASGILIRSLAPLLKDKRAEPPVVAVAEDGSSAVPLLGGHHGANDLARRIAAIIGGHAAVTTAGDLRIGVAFDEPPEGYVLANPEDMKGFAARVIAGADVTVAGAMPGLPLFKSPSPESAPLKLTVTHRTAAPSPDHLVYHPKTLALGVGCERGTDSTELAALVERTLEEEGLSAASIASVNSIDLKADEAALHGVARMLGAPLRFFSAAELDAEAPRLKNPSELVMKEVGCPGVAEGAALAAAGPEAELIVAKTKSARATVAIARAPSPILELRGRAQGLVSVIGLGPGDRLTRSPEASQALREAGDWVGYGLYLDLADDLLRDQTEHRFPLGEEEARVRHAIELAKQGKRVALVCSGDPGIYAMAALVYEIIDLEPCRIEVQVIPGISAFQAAAARAGAMIGHDFCCISLSDLLTPWDVIATRIKAAAEGDFVIAFYNPRSLKRRDQLDHAIAVLKAHRPADTPVIVASNLGRPAEKVEIVPLAEFDTSIVDMLTLVMVGSSLSKSFLRGDGRTYAYTPRGYAKKRTQ